MCGHGMIAITTALDRGRPVPGQRAGDDDPLRGPGRHSWRPRPRRVGWPAAALACDGVRFTNVPSYLAARSLGVAPDGARAAGRGRRVRLPQRRPRLRRRLLRHRRRRRAWACASCPSRHRRCAGRAPRSPKSCAATTRRPIRPIRTWASSTARSSSTATRHLARRPGPRRDDPQRHDLRRRRARPVAVRLGHERIARPAL